MLISGRKVAVAGTVVPNSTPLSPCRAKNSSPVRSTATPATSVARAAAAKTSPARPEPTPWSVAAFSFLPREWPRGSGRLSGASPPSRHDRPCPARLSRTSPTSHSTAIAAEAGARRPACRPGESWVPMTTTARTTTRAPSRTSRRLAASRAGGARGRTPAASRTANDRLDGDAAEDVADGDAELSGQGRADGDGELRQVGGDRERDEPAERAAEMETFGEHVGGVRQLDARVPDDGRTEQEQQQQHR